MTKDKLKDDVIRTICSLNSDISNTDVNNTLKPKINSINDRVTALENASQS